MKRVCVFCGSSSGERPVYLQAVKTVGVLLARMEFEVVYGGGRAGLMGALADAALSAGGRVTGIIPRALYEQGLAHEGLTELRVVADMSRRKAEMSGNADAFLTLPGGMGTLDEIAQVAAGIQLGLHHKPCIILNTARFFDPLSAFLDASAKDGFISPEARAAILIENEPSAAIARIALALEGDR